jgi:hypothetical protein
MVSPVQTITRALQLVGSSGGDVYLCNGTYRENVVVDNGVAIYGGYDCARDWQRVDDWSSVEPELGIGLLIRSVAARVHIEQVAFHAASAVTPGQSAQAAGVTGSADVTLRRVQFRSGDGAAGRPGTAGSSAPSAAPSGGAGTSVGTTSCDAYSPSNHASCSATAIAGGYNAGAIQTCTAGSTWVTRGGAGGNGANIWVAKDRPSCMAADEVLGAPGADGHFHTGDGVWRTTPAANLGKPGADGSAGAGAVRGIGSLQDGAYVATNDGTAGQDGGNGHPGKGGSGGRSPGGGGDICRSTYAVGSGGGQGGAGGCGGSGAQPGTAGGGSIALVVSNSSVKLEFARFVTGNGGVGGNGALGGLAQPGGKGGSAGTGVSYALGLPGQDGGPGGAGGNSGPGGGGPSIAVLHSGPAPSITDAVFTLGSPGAGGQAPSGIVAAANGASGEVVSVTDAPGP